MGLFKVRLCCTLNFRMCSDVFERGFDEIIEDQSSNSNRICFIDLQASNSRNDINPSDVPVAMDKQHNRLGQIHLVGNQSREMRKNCIKKCLKKDRLHQNILSKTYHYCYNSFTKSLMSYATHDLNICKNIRLFTNNMI